MIPLPPRQCALEGCEALFTPPPNYPNRLYCCKNHSNLASYLRRKAKGCHLKKKREEPPPSPIFDTSQTPFLIPTFGSRPAILEVEGVKVYVAIHDAYFLKEYRRLRQQILDCHPDRRQWTGKVLLNNRTFATAQGTLRNPNSTVPFLKAQEALDRFMRQEVEWYLRIGLVPPEGV